MIENPVVIKLESYFFNSEGFLFIVSVMEGDKR